MSRHDDPGDTELVATGSSVPASGPATQILPGRDVPLGGIRSMTVTRTLPQRELPTVGAWCFLDRFGPQEATMRVEPHPHIGLQTVTWPLTGEVRHRDSLGSDVVLKPGALNLMTSGHGIAHSEYSLGDEPVELDALQLWVALPESARHGAASFESHSVLPTVPLTALTGDEGMAVVVMGTLADVTSPATTHTPIVGAQISIHPGSTVQIPLEAAWEHAIVLLSGDATVDGRHSPTRGDLLYLGAHRDGIEIASDGGAQVFLIGGEPFADDLVMWWNFVGRTHEEIEEAWHQWQNATTRFGTVAGHGDVRIPAPPLPTVRLLPRRRVT